MTTNDNSEHQPVLTLAILWRARLKTMFGIDKTLTPKELGQLKLLRKSLGDVTSEAMDWALKNWQLFSHEARVQAGLSSAPVAPHIGFFLKHHAVAVNLMYSIAKNKTVKSTAEMCFISKIDHIVAEQKKKLQEEITAMSTQ